MEVLKRFQDVAEKHNTSISQDTREKLDSELKFLRNEKVTWCLLSKLLAKNMLTTAYSVSQQAPKPDLLFGDLNPQVVASPPQQASPWLSHKEVVNHLREKDFELRKQQEIVEWLEEITTEYSVDQKNLELVVQKVLKKYV